MESDPLDRLVDDFERARGDLLVALTRSDDYRRSLKAFDAARVILAHALKRRRTIHHRLGLAYRVEADELHRTPSSRYRNANR